MPSVGFESTISASERPQTYALDGIVTGTGLCKFLGFILHMIWYANSKVTV